MDWVLLALAAVLCLKNVNAWVLLQNPHQTQQPQEHRTRIISRLQLGGWTSTSEISHSWLEGPRASSMSLAGGRIEEFTDEEVVEEVGDADTNGGKKDDADTRTDEEKGLSHGYEGDYKVGDVVKVKKCPKIWSVKAYSKEGFSPVGLVGKVQSLVLYGRKLKSLCSAITPIKVEFQPDDASVAALGLTFERKFLLHFSADELELIQKA